MIRIGHIAPCVLLSCWQLSHLSYSSGLYKLDRKSLEIVILNTSLQYDKNEIE